MDREYCREVLGRHNIVITLHGVEEVSIVYKDIKYVIKYYWTDLGGSVNVRDIAPLSDFCDAIENINNVYEVVKCSLAVIKDLSKSAAGWNFIVLEGISRVELLNNVLDEVSLAKTEVEDNAYFNRRNKVKVWIL